MAAAAKRRRTDRVGISREARQKKREMKFHIGRDEGSVGDEGRSRRARTNSWSEREREREREREKG